MRPKARATTRATTPSTTRGNNRQQVPESVYKITCCPSVALTCCPVGVPLRAPGQQQHQENNKEVCAHHWDIEAPEGPTSTGVCRYCGEEREFRNSLDDYGPAEQSARAHTMICSSEYGTLGPRVMAEAVKE